ncbi:hypothetical protein TorRG33x02_017200 [Trema orientale]|uniref:Uncharacterized protein n=1 Tax=Trema orientale TaxID=63057 RepID=A0A2P5FY81_TREOI|nr:hypothetical protein TorRG33x02_017200 [Trema orientale]
MSSNNAKAISACPWCAYPLIIAFQVIEFLLVISLKTRSASFILPHFPYMSTSALPTKMFPSTQILTARAWTDLPSSNPESPAQALRTVDTMKSLGSRPTFLTCRKTSQAFSSSSFCTYTAIIEHQDTSFRRLILSKTIAEDATSRHFP